MPVTSNANLTRRKTVMLVEPNAFTRRLIRQMLKEIGVCGVVEAESAAMAEHMLKTNPVDAILLDWRAPGTDSARMLTRLRQADNPKTAVTPVIITSTQVDLELLERAANLSARSVILKPFSLKVLRAHILAAVGEIEAQASAETKAEAAATPALTPTQGDTPPMPEPALEESEIYYL
ncbi:response regulator [Stappia stellulata]|uniref:response regulator n=1 Tax=Stappia stellulata TaxID=71235 RepID=UPI00042703B9|nr:response regulator [Stappia stellulata]